MWWLDIDSNYDSIWFGNDSYLQYVNICARAVRNSLKDEARTVALKREANRLRFAKWENGVQKEQVKYQLNITASLREINMGLSFFL